MLQTPDKVYKLDAQVLAEEWAGLKVKVTGTFDPKTDVITVKNIEALVASPRQANSAEVVGGASTDLPSEAETHH